MGQNALVLRLGQLDAVARRGVLVLEIAVARSGLGRHEGDVADGPELGAVALWVKPRDLLGRDLAARVEPAEHHEGVAVAEGVAGAELDVIAAAGVLRGPARRRFRGFRPRRRLLRLRARFARSGGFLRLDGR